MAAPHGATVNWVAAWVAVIAGGAMGAAGALIVAVGIGVALLGQVQSDELLYFAVGIALLGGVPAVVGTVLFVLGIRVLNRARPAAAIAPRAAAGSGVSADLLRG